MFCIRYVRIVPKTELCRREGDLGVNVVENQPFESGSQHHQGIVL